MSSLKSTLIAAAVLVGGFSAGAGAADLYQGGGLKDGGAG